MPSARVLLRAIPCALGILAGAPPALAQNESIPSGFQLDPVITGVFEPGRPVGFAELPDGRFLIIERNTGNVRLHEEGGTTAPVIHTVPNVSISGERGLVGVAVDPDWPARPYVYLYYTFSDSTANPVVNVGHLEMFTASGDLSDSSSTNLALTSPYLVLDDVPDDLDIHNGGTLRFGPDGMLYLSLGDDGDACNSQDLSTLGGAILRLDVSLMPGAGSGPPDKADITPTGNPYSGPGENERLMWAWGLRNPFRMSVDPLSGDVFAGDVGLISFEEINRVPWAGPHGENFGWPHREGFIDPGVGRTCGVNNTFTDPTLAYAHGPIAAVVCGPVYRRDFAGGEFTFPPVYEGRLFYTDVYKGWIRALVDSAGTWVPAPVVPGQANSTDWVASFLYLTDLQVGSDGALYAMRLVPVPGRSSGLYRIRPFLPLDAELASAPATGPRVVVAPNPAPAAGGTRFRVLSPPAAPSELRIVDAAGRLVRSLPGGGVIDWDGRARGGRPLPAGVYFYSLRARGAADPVATGRVVLVR